MVNLILTRTQTSPRYRFWQKTRQGRIVGLYFNSVEIARSQDVEPGWQYIIEREGEHVIAPESKVDG
jgi:hypothetical protein